MNEVKCDIFRLRLTWPIEYGPLAFHVKCHLKNKLNFIQALCDLINPLIILVFNGMIEWMYDKTAIYIDLWW
jgi:hypothetical protein